MAATIRAVSGVGPASASTFGPGGAPTVGLYGGNNSSEVKVSVLLKRPTEGGINDDTDGDKRVLFLTKHDAFNGFYPNPNARHTNVLNGYSITTLTKAFANEPQSDSEFLRPLLPTLKKFGLMHELIGLCLRDASTPGNPKCRTLALRARIDAIREHVEWPKLGCGAVNFVLLVFRRDPTKARKMHSKAPIVPKIVIQSNEFRTEFGRSPIELRAGGVSEPAVVFQLGMLMTVRASRSSTIVYDGPEPYDELDMLVNTRHIRRVQ